MTDLRYPLHKSVEILRSRINGAHKKFERLEFSLDEVIHSVGQYDLNDKFADFPMALQELVYQGRIELLPGGRFRLTEAFPILPQTVPVTVPPAMADLLERHGVQARIMAEAYTQLYLVENGLRDLVAIALRAKNAHWWSLVPPDIQVYAERSFDSGRGKPRYSTQGTWTELTPEEKLTFTTFPQLRVLVERQWPAFERLLPDEWKASTFTAKLLELDPLRNEIGHLRPLSDEDRNRLAVQARDIADGLRRAG